MEKVDFILNGMSTRKVYGLKSISIGMESPYFRSEFMAMPVLTGVDKIFKLETSGTIDIGTLDVSSKTMRMLFGNKILDKPKQKVITTKLKHQKYSRPFYMSEFVPKEWSIRQVKSLQRFTQACYQNLYR